MVDSLDQAAEQKPGSEDQTADHAVIDALSGAGKGAGRGASDAPSAQPAGPSSAVQEINQADIDALLSAAGAASTPDGAVADDSPPSDSHVSQEAPPPPRTHARTAARGRSLEEFAGAAPAADGEERAAGRGKAAPPAGDSSRPTPLHPVTPFVLPDLNPPSHLDIDPKRVTMLSDVNLRVRIELGRTRMLVEDVLKLSEGSVVELDKPAGDPVDVYVNDRLVARGEVLVLADNFCVRISEVISSDPHRVSA